MIIKNEAYESYIVIVNGAEHQLDKKQSININAPAGTPITIKSDKKDSIHIDLTAIFFGGVLGDSTITRITTEYTFTVDECDTVIINNNEWNAREQVTIRAVYADQAVTSEEYTIPNLKKIKKKHLLFHLLLMSGFPVYLILILLFVLTDAIGLWLFVFAVIFLFFGLPSIKEIRRFKKLVTPNNVNEKLCEYANERRNKGDDYNEDVSVKGKLIHKILGKMFKFDEEK